MNAFLNALKNKSAQINTDMNKHINPVKIDRKPGGNWIISENKPLPIQIDSDFGTPNQKLLQSDNKTISVRIERVLNRNRIDVFFSDIPEKKIREELLDRGFHFDGERKAWYHKDTLINRCFLSEKFNAPDLLDDAVNASNLNDNDQIQADTGIQADSSLESALANDKSAFEDNGDPFKRYKYQIAALQHELKLDSADLSMKAIECLYELTFKTN